MFYLEILVHRPRNSKIISTNRSVFKTPEVDNRLLYISTWISDRHFKLNVTPTVLLIFPISKSALAIAFSYPIWWQCHLYSLSGQTLGPIIFFSLFSCNPHSVSQEVLFVLPTKGIQIPTISHHLYSMAILVQAAITSSFQQPPRYLPFFSLFLATVFSYYRNYKDSFKMGKSDVSLLLTPLCQLTIMNRSQILLKGLQTISLPSFSIAFPFIYALLTTLTFLLLFT